MPDKLVTTFNVQGYYVVKDVDPSFREAVQRAFAAAERWADGANRARLNWEYKDGSFKQFMNPHECDDSYWEIMRSPTIRRLVRALFLTRSMHVTHAKVSYKMVSKAQDWQPHQDSGYNTRPVVGATICVFLERCDRSNGTLELVPGSHRLGTLPHERIQIENEAYEQLRVAKMPDIPPVAIEGDAGDVLVFDRRTIHLSGTNTRGGNRCMLIFEVENFDLRSLVVTPYAAWHMMYNAGFHPIRATMAPYVVAAAPVVRAFSFAAVATGARDRCRDILVRLGIANSGEIPGAVSVQDFVTDRSWYPSQTILKDEGTLVTAAGPRWSYASFAPIRLADRDQMNAVIRIRSITSRGKIGFALVSGGDASTMKAESYQAVAIDGEETIIQCYNLRSEDRLIVRNAAPDGGASETLIKHVAIFPA